MERGFTGKFLGTGKTQEGVPVSEGGGYRGKFEERKKTQEGVPFWKGVYRKDLERRKIYIIFVTNNKN